MKKLIKILLALVVVIVVLLAVGVFALFAAIDNVAKRGIEQGASYALGVQTTLDSADVGIFSGKFSMSGLTVSNPEGFSSPHFLALKDAGVEIDYSSLQQEVVTLPVLRFEGIDLNLEKKSAGANYKAIIDSLKRFESGSPSDGSGTSSADKKFIVEKLTIDGVAVHADLIPVGGALTKRDVNIDTIELTNIGTGSKGVTAAQLVNIISKALLSAVSELGPDILPAELLSDLQGQLAGLENLSELGVGIQTTVGDIGKQAGETIDKVKEGVEGMGKDLEQGADDVKKKLEGLIPGGGG